MATSPKNKDWSAERRDLVVCLDFFPEMGGAHTWIYEVYRRWPCPVDLLARDYSGSPDLKGNQAIFDSQDHGSLSVHRVTACFKDISIFDPACIYGFKRLLKRMRAVVKGSRVRVHCLRAFPDGMAGVFYKRFVDRRTRVITYVHGEELNVADTSRQLRFFTRQVLSGSDLVIVNSRATQRRLDAFMTVETPVRIIHPGVDAAAYQVTPERIQDQREKWGCKRGETVLVTVARMEPRKNQANVLRALSLLSKQGVKVRYVIAGDGSEKMSLVELTDALGMKDRVLFPGVISQEEKIITFGAADIHVMASVEHGEMVEGFGIVFLEAGAAGIPSIGGNSGGQTEAVRHGETGLIVDGENIVGLAEALARLAGDRDLREKMGRQGRAFALENDWEEVVKTTLRSVGALGAS